MRVRTETTVDIECEVDVSLDDVLVELGERIDESEAGKPFRLVSALDWITRMLARVPDGSIAHMSLIARGELQRRLAAEAKRYELTEVEIKEGTDADKAR